VSFCTTAFLALLSDLPHFLVCVGNNTEQGKSVTINHVNASGGHGRWG